MRAEVVDASGDFRITEFGDADAVGATRSGVPFAIFGGVKMGCEDGEKCVGI